MIRNIPAELKALPQWVCAGSNKIPVNPRTGEAASVTDPETWAPFEEAVRAGQKYIGFVLTKNDPYCIIDLDRSDNGALSDVHNKILNAFESYTERSASGFGYHIIIRGELPRGVKRADVEAYSSGRYMICTGNIVRNLPINPHQEMLDVLFQEMQNVGSVDLSEEGETLTDEQLLQMASGASNGDKFDQLCRGEWREMDYPSQSEADFALLSILAFYSYSNEQVRRLFRMSMLGRRKKATDKYIDRALKKIRAQQPPPINLDNLKFQKRPEPTKTTPTTAISFPPGLVGEVAYYIYSTSIRPISEIALAASLALIAGICGRSYNISGSGLNQYLVILARTGSGKEGAASGIDNLIAAIRPRVPIIDQFMGPAKFASGQGLVRTLDTTPCFVSILGEFGLTLQSMCDPRAHPALQTLKQVLLDVYAKSGCNKVIRSTAYSDIEKNTKIVLSPNVTILGESTPETFFSGLDSSHIAEGLIPRFSIMEYTGKRPPRNRSANRAPDERLVDKMVEFVSISLQNNNSCHHIEKSAQALKLLDAFDIKADGIINAAHTEVELQLWNRAHLKALKLSGLVAVGIDPSKPVVSGEVARWAIEFVERDVEIMLSRFKTGDIGQGESKQHIDLKRVIEAYLSAPLTTVGKYGVSRQMANDQVIPYVYLVRRTANLAAFKNDKKGASGALRSNLQDLLDGGLLVELSPTQVVARYSTRGKAYAIGPAWGS